MKFPEPLIHGRLIKRYKRFLVDVELSDGKIIVAHCANPGSMKTLLYEGADVWVSPALNPHRKLKYTWEIIRIKDTFVGLNTNWPNKIVEEGIRKGMVTELSNYDNLRKEVKYGLSSRVDILLEGKNLPDCYVEIKSVTMRRKETKGGLAEFPDSVTARGTKHLKELSAQVFRGSRCVMFYLVQRNDCSRFSIAGDIDPVYKATLIEAIESGVEVICYGCNISKDEILMTNKLKIVI